MSTAANDDAAGLLRLIGEHDLRTYAAGGLPPQRRREIEGYLACNPDLAAQVMGAMHRGVVSPARRRGRRFGQTAIAAVAVVACGVSAWAGSSFDDDRTGSPAWRQQNGERAPDYVEDAAASQRASALRAAMASQPETQTLDTEEISRTLHLRLPALPAAWHVTDVQVFPSDDGPGVSLTATAPSGRHFSLFAVRADTPVSERPVTASNGQQNVVLWERHDVAFVLGGDATVAELLDAAKALSRG